MKKSHVGHLVITEAIWLLFTVAIFAAAQERNTVFWISYGFGSASVLMQGYAQYAGLVKAPGVRSQFYGSPIAVIGSVSMTVQLILSFLFVTRMGEISVWTSLAVSAAVLMAAAAGILFPKPEEKKMEEQDVFLERNVKIMASLQSKVRSMTGLCEEEELAWSLRQLSEELLYSDPVSCSALEQIEYDLISLVDELQKALVDQDFSAAAVLCPRAMAVLSERNELCKRSKESLHYKRTVVHYGEDTARQESQQAAKNYKKAAMLTFPAVFMAALLIVLALCL